MSGKGNPIIGDSGGIPATGSIAVDQQRNQMLASIAKALAVFVNGGTISGNLEITGNLTVDGTITPNQTKGIVGTTTNNNAQGGSVGEYISSTVLSGAAVSLVNATPKDITSIALSAGDWNVWGSVAITFGVGATGTVSAGWVSSTSASFPTPPDNGAVAQFPMTGTSAATQLFPAGVARFSLSAPTTVYLSCQVAFTGGTSSAYGFIGARRMR